MASADAWDITSAVTAGLAAAWNAHDMHAFACLFHHDAAFVNVAGGYLRGRDEIEHAHAAAHAGPFRQSALTAQAEDARRLSDDVIVARVRSELRGDDRVPGQARTARMTLVMEQRGGQWKIIAAHNTNLAAAPG